ncbi:19003_t:CDS:10 [Dentiscutata erythropus]|uniref:19003_t:CDS:1 n=1 Tax=Dentiscutata erythropus TaxID=1348616 RepID=A0A9N8WIT5_9GLOM|nr:19003_t:CDS:10 [Dentiscutata erythropus]
MKSICLVDKLIWNFPGNMNPHAFAFGDVDNDEDNEFVIGNLNGELSVFKGNPIEGRPIMTVSGLGTITCVAVGDIKNSGKNSIVCVNAEGDCNIFDMTKHNSTSTTEEENIPTSTRRISEALAPMIKPNVNDYSKLTFTVPVNCNHILIADIDGDGMNEIILARTDRILHVYSYETSLPAEGSTVNKPSSKDQQNLLTRSGNLITEITTNRTSKDKPNVNETSPTLKEKKKWFFSGQITSLSTATDPQTSSPLLLVGQPGGHFMIIDKNENRTCPTQTSNDLQCPDETTEVSTEIAKGLKWKNGKNSDVIALVTMDGNFTFFDLQTSTMSRHELQVTHKLFGVAAIDFTCDETEIPLNERGDDVFVACTWNGNTYIIDLDFNMVKFEFEGRVCAFAAGKYAVTPGCNIPCFIYVDFEDHITVYHNLLIDTKPVRNFVELMNDQVDQQLLSIDPCQYSPQIADIFQQCLYKLDTYKATKEDLEEKIKESKRMKHEQVEKAEGKESNEEPKELIVENEEMLNTQHQENNVSEEKQEVETNQEINDENVISATSDI